MFAVIKTGGKQYRVAANDVVTVGKLEGEPGETVSFAEVLFFGKDGDLQVGAPHVAGVTVAGEVVEHTRGAKVIAFKKRRRQNSKRKRGHRQDFTVVRITDILTGGAKPAAKAKVAKAELAANDAASSAETADAKPKRASKPKAEAETGEAKPARKTKAKADKPDAE
jgi:large subunit ribosomal protein L21